MNAPCAHYEIAQLDLELILQQIVSLYLVDTDRRQQLAAITPLPWDTSAPYGAEL